MAMRSSRSELHPPCDKDRDDVSCQCIEPRKARCHANQAPCLSSPRLHQGRQTQRSHHPTSCRRLPTRAQTHLAAPRRWNAPNHGCRRRSTCRRPPESSATHCSPELQIQRKHPTAACIRRSQTSGNCLPCSWPEAFRRRKTFLRSRRPFWGVPARRRFRRC